MFLTQNKMNIYEWLFELNKVNEFSKKRFEKCTEIKNIIKIGVFVKKIG